MSGLSVHFANQRERRNEIPFKSRAPDEAAVDAVVQPASVHVDLELLTDGKRDRHGDEGTGPAAAAIIEVGAAEEADADLSRLDGDDVDLGFGRDRPGPSSFRTHALKLGSQFNRSDEIDHAGRSSVAGEITVVGERRPGLDFA